MDMVKTFGAWCAGTVLYFIGGFDLFEYVSQRGGFVHVLAKNAGQVSCMCCEFDSIGLSHRPCPCRNAIGKRPFPLFWHNRRLL